MTTNILTISVLCVFICITGFSPSVVRAVIMAVVVLMGGISNRETDIFTSLAFAAILMLVHSPYTLFDIGFQLSFAATLSLVLFYETFKKRLEFRYVPGLLTDVVACTLAAQVGVLPVTALYFNKISIISLISNIFVVPVTQAITILGLIMAALGHVNIFFSQIIGYINLTFLTFILHVTKLTANLPFAVMRITTPSLFMIMVYYGSVLFFLWMKPKYKIRLKPIYYIVPYSTIVVIILIGALVPKGLEIVFLDVGQGDCSLIKAAGGKTVLIDGGGREGKSPDEPGTGETIVIPFLLDYGVSKLDLVVATHGHEDHIQGLIPILKDFKVGSLVIPDNSGKEEEFKVLLDIAKSRKIPVKACNQGDSVELDSKTAMTVLHPKKDGNLINSSLNNGSLVLKLKYLNTKVLFTGDVEEEVEALLVNDRVDIASDVLKVGHHGSITSTSKDFVDKLSARAAVISLGANNNFGHPSSQVLDRLSNSKVQVFRTDKDGAVFLTSNGKEFKIKRTVMVK